jgi:flagellar basal body-associated protein FliL
MVKSGEESWMRRRRSSIADATLLALALSLPACPALASSGAPEKSEHSSEGGSKAASSTTPYFILDPLPISIIRDSAGKGILVIEIGLDARTMSGRREVEHMVPRLRDLYIRVLNLYTSRDLHIHQPADALLIKTRLQMATDVILGPDKATVLLRQVLERRTQ